MVLFRHSTSPSGKVQQCCFLNLRKFSNFLKNFNYWNVSPLSFISASRQINLYGLGLFFSIHDIFGLFKVMTFFLRGIIFPQPPLLQSQLTAEEAKLSRRRLKRICLVRHNVVSQRFGMWRCQSSLLVKHLAAFTIRDSTPAKKRVRIASQSFAS